jgi:outer membrane cobalamin receptor
MKKIFTIGLFAISINIQAQIDNITTPADTIKSVAKEVDFFEMSLDELMNIPVSVASKTQLTARESPAILTVITAEEIKNLGSRDLIDVLNLVPGMNFGVDVQGVVGISSRGNWAHEGKILVLLDGQEMNEILFSSTQFGQRYDISQIEKIEIIRGPGSSIYGGYAELGVINIITKGGKTIKGVNVNGAYGMLNNTYARRNASIAIGSGTEKFNYSIAGYIGQGKRSNRDYTDAYGTTLNLSNYSNIFPGMLNASLIAKDFSMRVIYDAYSLKTIDQFDSTSFPADRVRFNSFYSELKYNLKPSPKLTITPKVNYKSATPWQTANSVQFPYNIHTTRIAPSVNANWDASPAINIVAGVDSYFDQAIQKNDSIVGYFMNGSNTVNYNNIGAFAQLHVKNKFLPLFIGARLDNHNQFGYAFSPRVGITKVFDKFHFKLLYSRAFRAAAIENIRTNPNIKPERTGVAELELGFRLTDNMILTGNIYDIRISNPIVFYVNDANPTGAYVNFDKSGTQGFEIEYRYKIKKGFFAANYAYYNAKNNNGVTLYQVPTNGNAMLAWPASKLNVFGNFYFTKKISLNPSLSYIAKRYAYTLYDTNGELILTTIDPKVYFNLNLQSQDLLAKGLDLSIGVNDIFNQGQQFIQPYNSGHAPLPGVAREFTIRLNYALAFKEK